MAQELSNKELHALATQVLDRLHEDLSQECDCWFHLRTKAERQELIDRAIDETLEQIRNGTFNREHEPLIPLSQAEQSRRDSEV